MGVNKAASLAATVLVAGWIAATGVAGADPQDPAPSPSPAPAQGPAPGPAPAPGADPAAAAAPKTAIDTDGIFKVGTDIAAGTYASAGPIEGGVCYWKRTGTTVDGGTGTLDNAMSKKPQVVAIAPTDASFKTDGCQPWSLTDAAPDAQPSGLLPGLLGKAQLAGIMADLNNRAAQAPAAPDPAPAPAP
jgi:hypothetical protein